MTIVFPPPLDLALFVGLACLVVALLGFFTPQSVRASTLGRYVRTLRLPLLAVGAVVTVSTLFAATPEARLANPVPSTVESIAVGHGVYLNNCSACHGADARGGGPQADTTSIRPPALTGPGSHLGQHTDGDLHYMIGNGLSGGMPAWAATLTDEEIWSVINYLRDLGSAP